MTDTTEYKVPFPIYHITYDSIHTWDALRQEYDGNQLVHVTDSVTSGHNYAGAFHFADGADETVEYEYDENGNKRQGLGDGVTVTLQVLVLSFPVRIRVTQHTKSPSA